MEKISFMTGPHGAQSLSPIGGDESFDIGNQLFALRGADGEVQMTGEELDSLARQWLAHSAIHDGYTKSELKAAFAKVCDQKDWKRPINSVVEVKDVDVTAKAIVFFTATEARFFKILDGENKGKMSVVAKGYRAGPAA